ncbi:DNA cytosine methyltransferase [Shewanella insulae]|uniref:DNA cytosine methyltransferase n=1 Tax=Shewanella insulae TaxID=2681496 RepID=UPI001EFE30F5|nr:DNA cytosine methyltransferase [Shewanella insulae]MCG9738765.1 DNA cytosine methyltransferase [Shewanella insulae]
MADEAGTYIDLFAGCGGLSLGLVNAGWKGVFAIEKSKDAFATLKHNLVDRGHYAWPSWLPQQEHGIEELLSKHKSELKALSGSVDLIAGGPPCQGFSPAGRRNPDDPRNKMAEHYVEVVKLVKPKYLLLENVKGFNSPFEKEKGKGAIPYSQIVKQRLESLGYRVFFEVIKSSQWGVPQLRPRFILIAIREDIFQEAPIDPFEELHRSRPDFLQRKGLSSTKPITVREAISDLEHKGKTLVDATDSPIKGFKQVSYKQPKHLNNYLALMRDGVSEVDSPCGLRIPRHSEVVVERFKRILKECPKGTSLSKERREAYGTKKHALTPLDGESPSATVTTLPDDILHYSEPRILTVREMARLQSFPDYYAFKGPYTTGGALRKQSCPKYTQVGNAVPPLLGEALGTMLQAIAR